MPRAEVTKAVLVTCELLGQALSDAAIAALVDELLSYPEPAVLEALARTRRECRTITPSAVLDRLPGQHPGPESAWAVVAPCLGNEALSLVWTDEMREAYGVAAPLADDPIAARLAFKETYVALVSRARASLRSPRWSVSLGTDPAGRERALAEAVARQQIAAPHAAALLPHLAPPVPAVQALVTRVAK